MLKPGESPVEPVRQVCAFVDLAEHERVEAGSIVVMVHVLGVFEKANNGVGQRQHHDFD